MRIQRVINKHKIIEAYIKEPYIPEKEPWETGIKSGWQVVITVGYDQDHRPIEIISEKDSKEDAVFTMNMIKSDNPELIFIPI